MSVAVADPIREAEPPEPVIGAVSRAEPFLFAGVAVAQALVLLTVTRYFPNWDGGAHTATAEIMRSGAREFEPWFTVDWFPLPGLLAHYMLIVLLHVVGPVTAEKIVAGGAMIALPFATRYACTAMNRYAGPLAWLSMPFAIGWFVSAGFYAFAYGLSVFFVILGYWVRYGPRLRGGRAVVLAALFVLAYAAHIVVLAMALLVVGIHLAWTSWVPRPGVARSSPRVAAPLVLCALPAMALTVLYLGVRGQAGDLVWLPRSQTVEMLVFLKELIPAYVGPELGIGFLVILTVLAVCIGPAWQVVKTRSWWAPENAFLAVAVIGLGLVIVSPDAIADGSFLTNRLVVVPIAGLLLWRAAAGLSGRVVMAVAAVGMVASVGLVVVRVPEMRRISDDIEEFVSAREVVGPGDTMVAVFMVADNDTSSPLGNARWVRPLHQATSYLMAQDHSIDLGHYEANFKYFPVHWRRGLNPQGVIGTDWITPTPGEIHLDAYERATGGRGRVDFVLVWGRKVASPEVLASPETALLKRQLAASYRRVFTSDRGLLEVYRHR